MSLSVNEGNAEFQLKVSEINGVIVFPVQVHGCPELCAEVLGEGFLPWFPCGVEVTACMCSLPSHFVLKPASRRLIFSSLFTEISPK